jgi:hypothetical protein
LSSFFIDHTFSSFFF